MTRTRKLIFAAGIAAVVSGGGVAIAAAATQQDPDPPTAVEEDDGDADDDAPLDEAARAKAEEAALARVGSGTVTEVESDDGGYEVEVRQADGSEIEVHLDRNFAVVTTQTDTED
jgi:uncharacterized membrane protein YkoI